MKFIKTRKTKEFGWHWCLVHGRATPKFIPASIKGEPKHYPNAIWIGDKIEVPTIEKDNTQS